MYISEERIKEVISHIKAGFNNIPQRERNLSAEGINYLLDKIEEKMLGDENKVDIKTKFNIGDKIWVVDSDGGVINVYSDTIESFLVNEDEIIIYCVDSDCIELRESDIVLYDDTEALIEKIIELDKELI